MNMQTELCDVCQNELEPSQIGKCDTCQENELAVPAGPTLNQQVAALLRKHKECTPEVDALLEQMRADETGDGEMHANNWIMYIYDILPAGGLWLEFDTWLATYRHSPETVAYMLDNDGELPPEPVSEEQAAEAPKAKPRLVPANYEELSPTGNIWVISGRRPYDDEDTTIVYLADDEEQVQQAFEAHLYEDCADDDLKQANIRDTGSAVFINFCSPVTRHATEQDDQP